MNYQLLLGDCLDVLKTLEAGSVQTCVTSPPYFGLRDYGTAQWEGGDAECDHVSNAGGTKKFGNPEFNENRPSREGTKTAGYYADICPKCGARRIDNQIGLEDTPDAYVAKLVDVFREVRRVLRDDGTLWLNLGDSYNGSGGAGGDYGPGGIKEGQPKYPGRNVTGLKAKDLIGIPWLVAFALRADGWWLRSDIIWHKPSPMPESVTDRPTKAHEYIFLLSKSASYYYDSEAVREGNEVYTRKGTKGGHKLTQQQGYKGIAGGTLKRDPDEPYGFARDITTVGRNRRSVWTVATKPYKGAHFATFPMDLIEPCILAGSKRGDTVVDPFNGSGTTGAVALKHGRNYIGIDLNADYLELAHKRIQQSQPTLLEVHA